MKSEFDLHAFADIPDPFAEVQGVPPEPALAPPALPAPAPGRARVRAFRLVALVLAIAYEVAAIAFLKLRPDFATMPVTHLVLGFTIPAAGGALALGAAARTGERGLGEPFGRLVSLTLSAPLLFAAATLVVSPDNHDSAFWERALACMRLSAILAAGPLVLALASMRRAFVVASQWHGAALGTAAGAFAATTLSLVCPNGNASHLLLGHGTMILGAGVLGALFSRHFRA